MAIDGKQRRDLIDLHDEESGKLMSGQEPSGPIDMPDPAPPPPDLDPLTPDTP